MLGRYDLITYENPPSFVARQTHRRLYNAINDGTVRVLTALLPEGVAGNAEIEFDERYSAYKNIPGVK